MSRLTGHQVHEHEHVTCARCSSRWATADLTLDGAERPICPECSTDGFYPARPDQTEATVARRWTPRIARLGWNATPDLILGNLAALGLTHFDYVLLDALERYRRGGADEEVHPKVDTLAGLVGRRERQVRDRLAHLRALGLIERRRRGTKSGRGSDAHTRLGLTAALDLIAANREAGRPDEHLLPELVDQLRSVTKRDGGDLPNRRDSAATNRRDSATRYRRESAREAEAVEAEAVEADSDSYESAPAAPSAAAAPPAQLPLGPPLKGLPSERDREVVNLDAQGVLTQTEIGRQFGISQGRVAQIVAKHGAGRGQGHRTDLAAADAGGGA